MTESRYTPEDDPDYTAEVGEPVEIDVLPDATLMAVGDRESGTGPESASSALELHVLLTLEQVEEISQLFAREDDRTTLGTFIGELVAEGLEARRSRAGR